MFKTFAKILVVITTVLVTGEAKLRTPRGASSTHQDRRNIQSKKDDNKGMMGMDSGDMSPAMTQQPKGKTLSLTVLNDAFLQPFSRFFVMVHNDQAMPLYIRGNQASEPLALLAENGDPAPLVEAYIGQPGVMMAYIHAADAPLMGGQRTTIEVEVTENYPLVTIATMAINTNDCFTAINGAYLYDGQVLDLPGLDSGSEENNEDCGSIPGPACRMINTTNVRSGNGEGFVHVHRGFFGIGPSGLAANRYDWRNPMMRVVVKEV